MTHPQGYHYFKNCRENYSSAVSKGLLFVLLFVFRKNDSYVQHIYFLGVKIQSV